MVCAKCNAAIADNAKFCTKCGEKVDKSLGAGDTVTCPECKAAYPKTTKFCKKDGTRLGSNRMEPTAPTEESKKPLPEAVEAPQFEPYQQPSAADSIPKKSKSKMPLVFVLLGILVIGSGVGSYFYFSKKSTPAVTKPSVPPPVDESKATPGTDKTEEKESPEKLPIPPQPEQQIKPGKLAKLINRDLKHKGLGKIYASVNSKMVVTLKGSANNPEEKTRAMNIAGMYKEAREVRDNIYVKEQPKPYTASPEPKALPAPKAPPSSQPPVKPVPKPQERPRINDPYLLASEINRALKNAGLSFVTASVTEDFEIYLMGMVTSRSDREKALRIARSFREGRKIIDQMMNNY